MPKSHEVTVSAFARLAKVTEGAIRKSIANGRLERAVRRDPATGRVTLDSVVGLREWHANRDPARVRE